MNLIHPNCHWLKRNRDRFFTGLSLLFLCNPISALAQSKILPNDPSNSDRLSQMFSPDIQGTMGACWDHGKPNLAAGANENGALICSDGSPHQSVKFNEYTETISDFFAASFLIGMRSVVSTNSQVTPTILANYFNSEKGQDFFRQSLESSLESSKVLPPNDHESIRILVDNIMQRSQPILVNPNAFNNLLGTTEQYQEVVQKFCTPPGMSVRQAQIQLPQLNSIQLYAICLKESGLVDNLTRIEKK